jgi:pilus assembly protein FimV
LDKNKIIEAAAKLVAKGAYDKAIKEYQKILDVDPKDVRILQKMGELYQKKNENTQAAQYFTKVAESYTSDGFFLKAVALFKQVLKLDPSLVEVNLRLAELHQQLQLLGEAMAYYQIVANHHDKQGETKLSLDVLRKMVELDPDNVPSRIKLADLYAREGMNADATTEFKRAADYLKRQNRTDDYLRVAERLSALEPDNLVLARELAELYLQRNDQKRALAKLQVCFKANSRDIDTLRLLAVAFQGLGQTSKTISVYKELARAYEDRGQGRDAEQTWAQVSQLDPNDPDVLARAQAVAPPPVGVPTANSAPSGVARRPPASEAPSPVPAPAAATGAQAAPKPKADGLGKLLTETDVYVKYGLHDKALEHLRKVFSIDPENIDAHEKAYAIYSGASNQAQAAEQLLNVLRLHTMRGDAKRAQPYLAAILQQNPGHPEVPTFLQTLRLEGSALPESAHTPAAEHVDDAILVDSSDDEVIVADDVQDEASGARELLVADAALDAHQGSGAADEVIVPGALADASFEFEPSPDAEGSSPQLVADFLADEPEFPPGDATTGEHELFAAAEREDGPTTQVTDALGELRPDEQAVTEPLRPSRIGLGEAEHESPTRELPRLEAEAYQASQREHLRAAEAEQSFADVSGPSADSSPDEASEWREPPTVGHVIAGSPEATMGDAEEGQESSPREEEPAVEECAEATFFIEQGLYEEAREILDTILIAYPDHRQAAALMQELDAALAGTGAPSLADGAAGPTDAGRDAFDLAQELADELGDFAQQPQAEAAQSVSGDDYQVSVEEVFAEFKKGLEKVVKPEDVDTHYDLGIAYKEMGLLDDAIGEFTVARKGCIGKRKEVDCLTMAAMLHMMKGEAQAAIEAFRTALLSEHAGGDTEKALRYDLGGAWEGAGSPGRALGQFLRVQVLDPHYRDVVSQVERLSATAAPEDDELPAKSSGAARASGPKAGASGAARKVGYV